MITRQAVTLGRGKALFVVDRVKITRSCLTEEFLAAYGGSPEDIHFFFAPGRVNLIGEHIDYNGGHVLPAAISLGIHAAVRYTGGMAVTLRSTDIPGASAVDLGQQIKFDARDGWTNYLKGVVTALLNEGRDLPGCQILFSGDLPVGAGLSSSAAIEVLTAYLLLYPSSGDAIDRIWLAVLCQGAENHFVGVGCGIMDQFSVAMGKKDCAILLGCSDLSYRLIPAKMTECRLLIMDTGKRRRLENSKFNERRAECEAALDMIRKHRPVPNLCSAAASDVDKYVTDPVLKRRATHVISENARTLRAASLLGAGDWRGFGRLLVESHESLRRNYEVTGPELDALVEVSLQQKACLGARMTGAGFGGCAIALVRTEQVSRFTEKVCAEYWRRTHLEASILDCTLADGVHAEDKASW